MKPLVTEHKAGHS